MLTILVMISGCITIEDESNHNCIPPEKFIDGVCCFDENNNSICDINERTCPETCDDNNTCTKDYCSPATNYECRHDEIKPCCGNNLCEENEELSNTYPEDCTIIKMTDFIHSFTGPDYMDGDTFVFIHTGSNETDKRPEFYLNISADKFKIKNIRYTYNCTDSATGHKIDSIDATLVEVAPGYPAFGHENKYDGEDYTIYTSFFSKEMLSSISVGELEEGKTVQFKVRFFKKDYRTRSKLTCDFDFYFLSPLKHVRKQLKISFI